MRTCRFVFAFVFGSSGIVFAQESKPAIPSSHICYFSMNNGKEFPEVEKFLTQLNKASPDLKITVAEYQTEGSNPEESFREMLRDLKAEGRHCDGLVLSGHHTGSFSGMRAQGTLGVEFLESLSCEPANREFFSKIQSVWLQGCRTMGVCKVAFGTEADRQQFAEQMQAQATTPAQSADFHTERVGAVLAEDHLTQSYAQLNTEFSATLDQDNPLSTRYLRIFPRAAVFGWTATAPGVNAKSEYSLPYHIAHTTKHMDDRKELFDNPRLVMSENSSRAYGSTLKGMLHRDHAELSKQCTGDACLKGWMDQASSKTMGFQTTEANALPPLVSGNSQALLRAKALECEIKNPSSSEAHAKALRDILEDPTQVAYNFNSLWELLQKTEEEGDEDKLASLRAQYAKSIPLANFLNHKFKDPSLGTLRKIDYYAFYRDMMGQKNDVIEGRILEAAKAVIKKEAKSQDQRDYQETMIKSLVKNKLISDSFVNELVGGSEVHPNDRISLLDVVVRGDYSPSSTLLESLRSDPRGDDGTLSLLTHLVKHSDESSAWKTAFIEKIIDDKRSSARTLANVAFLANSFDVSPRHTQALLQKLISDKRTESESLERVAQAVSLSEEALPQAKELLQQLIRDPRGDEFLLSSVATAISDSNHPISGAEELLIQCVSHKNSDMSTLSWVAEAVGNSNHSMPDGVAVLNQIFDSQKGKKTGDDKVFRAVAGAVGNSKHPLAGSEKLLNKMLGSQNNSNVSKYVADAIAESRHPIPGAQGMLDSIVSNKKAPSYAIELVAQATRNSQHSLSVSKESLLKIMKHPATNGSVLRELAVTLASTPTPISGADELLESIVKHPRASQRSRSGYIEALASGRFPAFNAEQEFERYLKSPDVFYIGLEEMASSVILGKTKVTNPVSFVERVARHPNFLATPDLMKRLINEIENTSATFEGRDRLIQSLMRIPAY